jgi:hypothetical protein
VRRHTSFAGATLSPNGTFRESLSNPLLAEVFRGDGYDVDLDFARAAALRRSERNFDRAFRICWNVHVRGSHAEFLGSQSVRHSPWISEGFPMWKKIALVSMGLNVLLCAALLKVHGSRRVVTGRLSTPLLDFSPLSPDRSAHNTQLLNIRTDEGGEASCRMASLELLMHSPANKDGASPAIATVDIVDTDLGPRCLAITTVREGFVSTPK